MSINVAVRDKQFTVVASFFIKDTNPKYDTIINVNERKLKWRNQENVP